MLAYLAGIASEAIMYCSPTMYASGARVYYLTDLLYLFIILTLAFSLKRSAGEMDSMWDCSWRAFGIWCGRSFFRQKRTETYFFDTFVTITSHFPCKLHHRK